jgi:hypothetical protein
MGGQMAPLESVDISMRQSGGQLRGANFRTPAAGSVRLVGESNAKATEILWNPQWRRQNC